MTTLRDYLKANLTDGNEDRLVSWRARYLLDEVSELVAIWMVDQSGVRDKVEEYFGA